ncbi:hypothetical protein I350_00085 [Cryptococcus amylolentus CBS 6273]|uniref:Uncharacterized protein n=1 Tax=Cryptococcus amylolentus CBS 6273 TaxID=1296118 RepID=A0A1E3KDZ5_9TREE|nr:hypothetical protein I350_00085 [Cryptococcus amylolentus CBS 6273]
MMLDPLMIAHPPSGIPFDPAPEDEPPFDTYCIVCDKRIPPLSSGKNGEKKKKKVKAGGTIRVKNADGTTTTRNAKGKVTRPPLRNSNSSSQSTTITNTTTPLPPLARPKTTDGTIPTSATVSSPETALPSTSLASTLASTPGSVHSASSHPAPGQVPFHSPIYCSRECQEHEAGRSDETYKELARTMSFDFSHAFHSPEHELELVPLPTKERERERGVRSPFAPPSPVGTSDTESSNSAGLQGSSGEEGELPRPSTSTSTRGAARGAYGEEEAASAPKIMDYFRFSKGGPDQAWNEVSLSRQRRSSMQPSAYGAYGHITPGHITPGGESSSEMDFARSMSGGGRLRGMTPVKERRVSAAGPGGAERAVPIPVRPMARSNLSQTSLGGASVSSQHSVLPPEFGSAPTHTLGLLQSYASAFPVRSSCNTPNSFSQRGSTPQRGFVFPETTVPLSSSTRSPSPPDYESLRRDSASSISRSQGGTIKAKKIEPTWDSFGRKEVQAQSARQNRRSGGGGSGGADSTPVAVPRRGSRAREQSVGRENTPRQKMEKDGQGWRYVPSSSPPASASSGMGVGRSGTVRRKSAEEQSRAVSIGHGRPPQLSTSTTSHSGSHTPSSRYLPTRSSLAAGEPDMAGLTLGEAGEKLGMGQSVPRRIGFNWDETMGVKTYELPGKMDKNQKGLFYFQ